MNKKKIFIVSVVVLVIAALGIGGAVLLLMRNQTKPTLALSAAEKREILEKVAQNNPTSYLEASTNTASTADAAAVSDRIASPLIIVAPNDNNYMYSKSTLTRGAAFDTCKAFGEFGYTSGSEWENFNFYDETGNSYSKSIVKDEMGELISYNLSSYTTTESEYYDYRGGQYAAKIITKYDDNSIRPMPLSVEEDVAEPENLVAPDAGNASSEEPASSDADSQPTDLVDQLFGPDADIVDIVVENGVEYYVMQYNFPVDCDAQVSLLRSSTEREFDDSIITQNWVQKDNYQIYKASSYLNAVSDATLLSTTTNTFDSKDTSFTEVAANFEFEFEVQIKEIQYELGGTIDPEEEAERITSYLRDSNYKLLFVSNAGATLSSIYSAKDNFGDASQKDFVDYYTDRAFYPNNELGQKMYDEATQINVGNYIASDTTLSFLLDNVRFNSITIEQYQKSVNTSTLVSNYTGSDPQGLTNKSTEITIEGNAVTVMMYEYNADPFIAAIEDTAVSSEDNPVTPTDIEPIKIRFVIFEYGNYKYLITLPNEDDFDVTTLTLDELDAQNTTDLDRLRSAITETYKPQTGSGSEPSDPGLGVVCTQDAKVCDDGSAVGRDPNNNCEFFLCPGE